jgi:hypothetical protein
MESQTLGHHTAAQRFHYVMLIYNIVNTSGYTKSYESSRPCVSVRARVTVAAYIPVR